MDASDYSGAGSSAAGTVSVWTESGGGDVVETIDYSVVTIGEFAFEADVGKVELVEELLVLSYYGCGVSGDWCSAIGE